MYSDDITCAYYFLGFCHLMSRNISLLDCFISLLCISSAIFCETQILKNCRQVLILCGNVLYLVISLLLKLKLAIS